MTLEICCHSPNLYTIWKKNSELKQPTKQGSHTCNQNTAEEEEAGGHELEASVGYKAAGWTAA